VEHAHPLPDRPWKAAAVLASGVAVVELAALVVLAVGAIAEPVAEEAQRVAVERTLAPVERPAPTPRAEPTSEPVALPRGETAVVVLNGNGVAGAAAGAGERIKRLGYVLGAVGNAPRADYARTLVMYRPGREAEGRRLARDLGVRVVAPLDGLTPGELMGAHAALVIGAR
jgi:hypothetical protein